MLPVKADGIAGEEVFALADADDERAAQPRTDNRIGKARADDGQAVGALEHAAAALLHRLAPDRRSGAYAIKLGDHLGVGLAGESDRLRSAVAACRAA